MLVHTIYIQQYNIPDTYPTLFNTKLTISDCDSNIDVIFHIKNTENFLRVYGIDPVSMLKQLCNPYIEDHINGRITIRYSKFSIK